MVAYSDLIHPMPEAVLCAFLNLICPGLGISISAYYGPKGLDLLTFAFGIFINFLWNCFVWSGHFWFFWSNVALWSIIGFMLWLVIIISAICFFIAALIHLYVMIHSYFIFKLSRDKYTYGL